MVRLVQHRAVKFSVLRVVALLLPPERHDGDQPQIRVVILGERHGESGPQVESHSHTAKISIVSFFVKSRYGMGHAADDRFADRAGIDRRTDFVRPITRKSYRALRVGP